MSAWIVLVLYLSLKTESPHDADFIITVDTKDCHNNLQYHLYEIALVSVSKKQLGWHY